MYRLTPELFEELCRELVPVLPEPRRSDSISPTRKPEHRIDCPVDLPFISQLEELASLPYVRILVRNTQEVRMYVRDDADREHNAYITRLGPDRFRIVDTSIPFDAYRQEIYPSLMSAVDTFRTAISSLQEYFSELDRIDSNCWVVDPPLPTYKEDYRRIVLEDRVWLHIDVSAESAGGRLRVVGASEPARRWSQRLAARLTLWDSDASVLDNIINVLEIDELPQPPSCPDDADDSDSSEYCCAICLCGAELGTERSLPQPLCANTKCGSYMHATCLFQWLVAASGGVVPKLRVVTGKCPCCLAPITCSELDM